MKIKSQLLLYLLFSGIICCYADELMPPDPPFTNTWIGVTSEWNDKNNWSLGEVPEFFMSVVINNVVEPHVYPIINTSDNTIEDCVIDNNATLTIDCGGELLLTSHLENNGKVIINHVKDDYASLIIRGDISGTGNYESSLLIEEKLYHYYGIPHQSLTYENVSTVNASIRMKQYIDNANGYEKLTAAHEFDTPTQGYFMGSLTADPIILKGEIYQGGFVHGLNQEFNIICNPYVAPIDIKTLLAGNQQLIDDGIINNSIITFEQPDDHHRLLTHYLDEPILGSNQVDGVIKPGEAFLIRANKTGLFIIDESFCKPKNEMNTYDFTDLNNRQYIRLKLNNSATNDDVVLVIDEEGSQNTHLLQDCYKMSYYTDLDKAHIALYINKKEHQIKFVNFDYGTIDIPLRLNFSKVYDATSFQAELSDAFPADIIVELIDANNTTPFNLRNGKYEFSTENGMNYNFSLRLTRDQPTSTATTNEDTVEIYVNGHQVIIEGLDTYEYSYKLYNLNGQIIQLDDLNGATQIQINNNGFYVLEIKNGNNRYIKKLSIK